MPQPQHDDHDRQQPSHTPHRPRRRRNKGTLALALFVAALSIGAATSPTNAAAQEDDAADETAAVVTQEQMQPPAVSPPQVTQETVETTEQQEESAGAASPFFEDEDADAEDEFQSAPALPALPEISWGAEERIATAPSWTDTVLNRGRYFSPSAREDDFETDDAE